MHFWVYLILNNHSVLNIVQFRLTGCMAVNLQYKFSLTGDAVKHEGSFLSTNDKCTNLVTNWQVIVFLGSWLPANASKPLYMRYWHILS